MIIFGFYEWQPWIYVFFYIKLVKPSDGIYNGDELVSRYRSDYIRLGYFDQRFNVYDYSIFPVSAKKRAPNNEYKIIERNWLNNVIQFVLFIYFIEYCIDFVASFSVTKNKPEQI